MKSVSGPFEIMISMIDASNKICKLMHLKLFANFTIKHVSVTESVRKQNNLTAYRNKIYAEAYEGVLPRL